MKNDAEIKWNERTHLENQKIKERIHIQNQENNKTPNPNIILQRK